MAVRTQTFGPVSAGVVQWTFLPAGAAPRRYLTVVVRASFRLVPGGPMTIVPPEPIAPREVCDADGSPREPGDLAPYLPQVEIWVRGHLRPRPGTSDAALRIMIVRQGAKLFAKTARIAVPAGSAAVRLGAFEPVRRDHPARVALLRGAPPPDLDRAEGPALPAALDLAHFHAVPADQTCPALAGGETLVLDGFHADIPRIETRLPRAIAAARADGLARGSVSFDLLLDSIGIDLDRATARLLYRGNVELAATDPLPSVLAGLSLDGPIQFPAAAEVPMVPDPSSTVTLDPASMAAILARLGLPATATSRSGEASAASPRATPGTALDGAATIDVQAALAGHFGVLPFAPASAPAAPRPARDGADTVGLQSVSPGHFGGLPFAPASAAPAALGRAGPAPSPVLQGGQTVTDGGVDLRDVLRTGATLPFAAAAPPQDAAGSGEPAALPAPPGTGAAGATGAETLGLDGPLLAALLAPGGPLPFAASAAAPAARAEPSPARDLGPSGGSGGMTMGLGQAEIQALLRPATPFSPPAHLGARPIVLLPKSERPARKLSLFFLDALRALGANTAA